MMECQKEITLEYGDAHLSKLVEGAFMVLSNFEDSQIAAGFITNVSGKRIINKIQKEGKTLKRNVNLVIYKDLIRSTLLAVSEDANYDSRKLAEAFRFLSPIIEYYAKTFDGFAKFKKCPKGKMFDFFVDYQITKEWYSGENYGDISIGLAVTISASLKKKDFSFLQAYFELVLSVSKQIVNQKKDENKEPSYITDLKSEFSRVLDLTLSVMQQNNKSKIIPTKPEDGYEKSATSVDRPLSKPTDVYGNKVESDLELAIAELNKLIGIGSVKSEVKKLINYLKVQKQRKEVGLAVSKQSLHFVFTGNPGTGKTTVARILAKILHGFGLLSTSNLIECDRSSLVGGYLGQTAIKSDELIKTAIDGVLFVDEAYSLASSRVEGEDLFGNEAISTLLKRMEDYRDRLVVIVAGYPEPMKRFLGANPGLESRFTRHISFSDYIPSELCQIFQKMIREADYELSPEACVVSYVLFFLAYSNRDINFGNARFVRNQFEKTLAAHSDRVANIDNPSRQKLLRIEKQDIPADGIGEFSEQLKAYLKVQWAGKCPKCGKSLKTKFVNLGQRVTCPCGEHFVFPWWDPIDGKNPGDKQNG